MAKKKKSGRPKRWKYPAALRKYWREHQRRYRAKKKAQKAEK